MHRCPQCKVILYQKSNICPLCQCVAEKISPEDEEKVKMKFGEGAPYPDIQKKQKIVRFILRLVLFIFIVAEAIMMFINKVSGVQFRWSWITGASLIYIYLFLLYWVRHDSGFAAKIGLQLLFTMVILFEADVLTGMHGWALQWAIPGIILLGDGIVFFLMMLDRRRWYSYTLLLMLMGLCSIAILLLYVGRMIGGILMPGLCVAVTGMYLLATVIFGDRKVERELKRRFHI